jgi:hypothetical protein
MGSRDYVNQSTPLNNKKPHSNIAVNATVKSMNNQENPGFKKD